MLSRIARRWNQSGQKHAGASDIAGVLLGYPTAVWLLVVLTLLLLFSQIRRAPRHIWDVLTTIGTFLAMATTLLFKVVFSANDAPELLSPFLQVLAGADSTSLARTAVLCTAGLALVITASGRDRSKPLLATFTIFLLIQTRVTNIPLFAIFTLQWLQLESLNLTTAEIAISTLLLAHASFFCKGGTNAISSLDLSNAYNGISGYNATLVGLQLFIGNWAGSIFWSIGGLALIRSKQSDSPVDSRAAKTAAIWLEWRDYMSILTLFMAVAVTAVMAACTALRVHLFVWTVFSPKFLYVVVWSLGWHIGVNGLFGGLIVCLGNL